MFGGVIIIVIVTSTSSTGQPVGYKNGLLMQHLNAHKQQTRALGLHIIIHHTHAPVDDQSHRIMLMILIQPRAEAVWHPLCDVMCRIWLASGR
jgi:hypothetical protein